jgi:protein ImuB
MLKQGTYQAKAQLQLFDAVNNSTVEDKCAVNAAGVTTPHFPTRRAVRSGSLWLCIRFPELCLEALGSPRELPAAVLSEQSGVTAVLACNDKAVRAGIAPGMSLNAALVLVPALDVRQRRESAEIAMLQARANWALAYTPVVSINPAGALLLELGGSLRLFGGLSNLRSRLLADLHTCGCRVVIASAPVAKAALWLATAGKQPDCTEQHKLPGLLADLPLGCLSWPVAVQRQLMQMGIRTLGDCVRLPRDGFARRVGPGYLHELDQGFGRSPDLPDYYQPPEDFHDTLELIPASLIAGEVAGVLHELCSRLSVFLRQRQANVQQLNIRMEHCGRDSTPLEIVLREPCTSANYFLELLHLQLDKHMLPAPVTGVSLQASVIPAAAVAGRHLQADVAAQSMGSLLAAVPGSERNTDHTEVNRLIERLRARLGTQHVYGLNLVAEHRPERAWAVAEPSGVISSQPVAGQIVSRIRPLWLFASPRRMETRCGEPVYRGRLVFVSDAERIESGWWDGHDIRRDYYTVTGDCGRRLWIYRDRRDSGWYLHGLFG